MINKSSIFINTVQYIASVKFRLPKVKTPPYSIGLRIKNDNRIKRPL